jgi:hypothetical protein
MNAINPRMLYSPARPAPHVITERTNGTHYFVGARIADAAPRSSSTRD